MSDLSQPAHERRSISVTGTGRASAVPDALDVNLALTHEHADVARALHDSGAAIDNLVQAIADLVPAKDRQTIGLDLRRNTDREGRFIGHTATQGLRLTVHDPALLPTLLGRASESAGNALHIGGIQLVVSEPAALQLKARQRAVDDARATADALARAAGATLGTVLQLEDYGVSDGGQGHPMMAMARGMADSSMDQGVGGSVEVGENTITATVRAVFELH